MRIINLFLFCLFSIGLSCTALAQSSFIYQPNSAKTQDIPGMIYMLEDPKMELTIEDVSGVFSDKFVKMEKRNLGFSKKGAIWVKVVADLTHYKDKNWYLSQHFTSIGNLTLYKPLNGSWTSENISEFVTTEHRSINNRLFLFKVPTSPNPIETYYLRYDLAGHAANIDLLWHNESGIIEFISIKEIILGLFFGCLIIMWVYNAFLYFIIGNKSYLYYLYYLACFILVFVYLNGMVTLFIGTSAFIDRVFAAFGFGAVHGMTLFARHFLELKKFSPKLNLYIQTCQILLVIGGISIFFTDTNPYIILNALILITLPSLVLSGIKRSFDRYTPAYIYTAAWAFFVVALFVYSLRAIGAIPSNFFSTYSLMIASVWESVVFALALGYRVKMMELEKNNLITQQTQREINLLENEQRVLEDRVNERTVQLKDSLSQLEANQVQISLINNERKILIESIHEKIEAERKRIALDLHDTINTVVIAIIGLARDTKIQLEQFCDRKEVGVAMTNLQTIENRCSTVYSMSRNLISNLRSEVLDDFGLAVAIAELVKSKQDIFKNISFNTEIDSSFPQLSHDINIEVYRICQESISNVLKHANATQCGVNLTFNKSADLYEITLSVKDNGIGFDVNDVCSRIGLIGMRERAQTANGSLCIISSVGQGTEIIFKCETKIQNNQF